jgi:glycosyltransferase involved in cell wall biosynthesis
MSTRVGVVIATDERGGAEQYLLRLYGGLRGRGLRGHLIGRLPGWAETGLAGTPTRSGPKWSRATIARSVLRAPAERRAVEGTIREIDEREGFDLFHLQFKREQILLTRRLAARAPVVWTEHGTLPSGPGSAALRAAYRRAATHARVVICVSEAVAADVTALCGDRTTVRVIENAVDTARFGPPDRSDEPGARRRELGLDPTVTTIGVVSRLHRGKRLERVVAALPADGELAVVVAGDGPDRTRLEGAARGRPVRFLGWVDPVDEIYRAVDAVFVPAAESGEGVPTTAMLEAAASGCALIAIDGDAVAGAVREAGGVVLAPGALLDPDELRTNLAHARGAARRWAAARSLGPWLDRHATTLEQARG